MSSVRTLTGHFAREGIEPPTRGFLVNLRGFEGFINQSLAASCRPLPRHTKAQSWHTQSELVTNVAQHFPAVECTELFPKLDSWTLCPALSKEAFVDQTFDLPGFARSYLTTT